MRRLLMSPDCTRREIPQQRCTDAPLRSRSLNLIARARARARARDGASVALEWVACEAPTLQPPFRS